ncbi:hypothetical protein C8Q79DRAFT_971542 [Trametes meyenii]|nr:hypothetical protein C8Q79DRAFT_971542 [Trametes meyenii]
MFDYDRKMVTILHSGMPLGLSSRITFGTPAHSVIEKIRDALPRGVLSPSTTRSPAFLLSATVTGLPPRLFLFSNCWLERGPPRAANT